MADTAPTDYAPRTRAGSLISSTAFAVLAASTTTPLPTDAVGPVMGVGFVVVILMIVHVPRLIRPGRTWLRARLTNAVSTSVFLGSGIAALVAVTAGMCGGEPLWGHAATGVIVVGALVTAAAGVGRRREDRP